MLTADLVHTRKRTGRLSVVAFSDKFRDRARRLALVYVQLARELVGQTCGQLQEAWDAVAVEPKDRKLAFGLRKLVEDACTFEEPSDVEPRALRAELFARAARARRALGVEFSRADVVAELAQERSMEAAAIDSALFGDLRSEHRLLRPPTFNAEQLVDHYEMAQYQAVLLRAVNVTARVRCRSALHYRDLFRALKFRRLLYTIEREALGYTLRIDGPFSLFDSVTKYGVQLAMVFPTLCACDELQLEASVRWGKSRETLQFDYARTGEAAARPADASLPAEVDALLTGLRKLELQPDLELSAGRGAQKWAVQVNEDILDLPGVGLCIPDLVFTRGEQRVYLEVLGFWSRDAVWKRVELVQAGLPYKVLFAVSSRLRVSEEVLESEASAGLYVYKGAMNPRAVLDRVQSLMQTRG